VSGVIGWIKAHIAIVVLVVIIVIAPPAGCIGSGFWNKSIRESQQTAAKADYDKLNRARVTYTLPAVLPGEEPISDRRYPNPEVTEAYAQWKAERKQQVAAVKQRAVERNRAGHELLLPRLFPAPPPREDQFLRLEFIDTVTGTADRPPVLQSVLDDLNAGEPVEGQAIAQLLNEYRDAEIEKYQAEFGTDELSDERASALEEELVKRRIGALQARADELSLYASLEAFPEHLRRGPPDPPALLDCFEWQWDLWVIEDVGKAIAKANASPDGGLVSIPAAPIKRLKDLRIQWLPTRKSSQVPEAPSGGDGLIATDPSVSITGRLTHQGNNLYDVRPIEVTLVVESARVPEVIDAFNTTNLMTVLDVDLREVDVWEDIEEGFYYGPAHVVEATLTVETVWLREWTAPLMPEDLRVLMYVELEEEPVEGAG